MLKAEEENIEETSSDNSGETGDEEEAKTPLPATRPGISKCTSMKVQAAGNFEVGGTSKSALQKTNRQGVVPTQKKENTKLPSLTGNRGTTIMQESDSRPKEAAANRVRGKTLQAKFNSSMDVPSNTQGGTTAVAKQP